MAVTASRARLRHTSADRSSKIAADGSARCDCFTRSHAKSSILRKELRIAALDAETVGDEDRVAEREGGVGAVHHRHPLLALLVGHVALRTVRWDAAAF